MIPEYRYLLDYLREAAIQQVSDNYENMGFKVIREAAVADIKVDLIVKRGNKIIVFEFKIAHEPDEISDKISVLRKKIREKHPNAEFKLVYVSKPIPIDVEIDNIDEILLSHLIDRLPPELDLLSTHTRVTGVENIELDKVHLSENELTIIGTCTVEVTLQYGSDSDMRSDFGLETEESFTADFEIKFEGLFGPRSIDIAVDTSSWDK